MRTTIHTANLTFLISLIILCQTPLLSEYGSQWGINGYNMVFKPNGGYAAIGNVNDQSNSAGTFEAWVYNAGSNQNQAILSKGHPPAIGFVFGIASTQSLYPNRLLFYKGSEFLYNTDGLQIPINKWTHVAVSWNQTVLGLAIKFYVDGGTSGSVVYGSSNWNWGFNTDSLTIGFSESLPLSGFKGYVDEVRLWSTNLNQSMIATNRFVGLGNYNQANNNSAITSSIYYKDLLDVWDFNLPLFSTDNFGGHNAFYRNNSLAMENPIAGQPLPYNMALRVDGNDGNDYVKVNHNNVFNQIDNYSIEAWLWLDSSDTPGNGFRILGKGSWGWNLPFPPYNNTTFQLSVYQWGSNPELRLINSAMDNSGWGTSCYTPVPMKRWVHVAVVWQGSGNQHLVIFYINGKQTDVWSVTGTVQTNNDNLDIGTGIGTAKGYLDEVRYWNRALTSAEIRKNMLKSCRDISDPGMVGAWNFDGNLENIAGSSVLDGSFNTGGDNKLRFSGYFNEQATIPLSPSLNPHPTVLDFNAYSGLPNGDFYRGVPSSGPIPQGVTKSYYIWVSEDVPIDEVAVLLSLQHPTMSELNITLRAPNGQYKVLFDNNGSNGNDILTVFRNSANISVTNADIYSPWSEEVSPVSTAYFRGSTYGLWALDVKDEAVNSAAGYFIDWGLRFNGLGDRPAGDNNSSPYKFSLSQNFPNPFNPVTKINYSLAKDSKVKITVFDILGRETIELVDEFRQAGQYNVEFDGSKLASGVYFYKIEAGSFTDVKKMILVK